MYQDAKSLKLVLTSLVLLIGSAHGGTGEHSLIPDDLNIEDLFQDQDSNDPSQVRSLI